MAKIQRKADRKTRRRIVVAAVLFCVLFSSAVICRLAWLQIINQELDSFYNEQEGELDRESRFCVDVFFV